MAATFPASRTGTYSVPQRFGISAILALTTLFAFVFAALRAFNAPAIVYFFFGTLAVSICIAQMVFGKVPRLASIAAGAVLLPFWTLVMAVVRGNNVYFDAIAMAVTMSPFTLIAGAVLGYLSGTVLAGFFLLLDMAQAPKAASAASKTTPPDALVAEIVEAHSVVPGEFRE